MDPEYMQTSKFLMWLISFPISISFRTQEGKTRVSISVCPVLQHNCYKFRLKMLVFGRSPIHQK